jgi:hypothetical protein
VDLNGTQRFDPDKTYRSRFSLFDPYVKLWMDYHYWQTGVEAVNETLIIFKIPITGRLPYNQIFIYNDDKTGEKAQTFKVDKLQMK